MTSGWGFAALGLVLVVIGVAVYSSNRKKLLEGESGLLSDEVATGGQVLRYLVLGILMLAGSAVYLLLYMFDRLPQDYNNPGFLIAASASLVLSILTFAAVVTGRRIRWGSGRPLP